MFSFIIFNSTVLVLMQKVLSSMSAKLSYHYASRRPLLQTSLSFLIIPDYPKDYDDDDDEYDDDDDNDYDGNDLGKKDLFC